MPVHFFHGPVRAVSAGLAYESADVSRQGSTSNVLEISERARRLTNRIAALVESSLQAPILAGALQALAPRAARPHGDDAIEYDDVVPLLSADG